METGKGEEGGYKIENVLQHEIARAFVPVELYMNPMVDQKHLNVIISNIFSGNVFIWEKNLFNIS